MSDLGLKSKATINWSGRFCLNAASVYFRWEEGAWGHGYVWHS